MPPRPYATGPGLATAPTGRARIVLTWSTLTIPLPVLAARTGLAVRLAGDLDSLLELACAADAPETDFGVGKQTTLGRGHPATDASL